MSSIGPPRTKSSVDELYEYVYDQVREATPSQTPSRWTFDVEGELFVARSKYRAVVEPAELPLELGAAIGSSFANVRRTARPKADSNCSGSPAASRRSAGEARWLPPPEAPS